MVMRGYGPVDIMVDDPINIAIDSAASSMEGWKPESERFHPKCGKCAVLGKYCKKHQPKEIN